LVRFSFFYEAQVDNKCICSRIIDSKKLNQKLYDQNKVLIVENDGNTTEIYNIKYKGK